MTGIAFFFTLSEKKKAATASEAGRPIVPSESRHDCGTKATVTPLPPARQGRRPSPRLLMEGGGAWQSDWASRARSISAECAPVCPTERGFRRESGSCQATGGYLMPRHLDVLVDKRHTSEPSYKAGASLAPGTAKGPTTGNVAWDEVSPRG